MATIIGWHSFKGGSGRSLALANVAYCLAKSGRRVGCLDLDIESAGLAQIFSVELGVKPSVTELLREPELARFNRAVINIPEELGWKELASKGGAIMLIACKQERPENLARVTWTPDSIQRFMGAFMRFVTTQSLDYVLVDSRSGISQQLSTSIAISGRNVVILSRADRQSRSGTLHMIDLIKVYSPDITPIVAVNALPDKNAARDVFRMFRRYLIDNGIRPDSIIKIPFDPDLLLQEDIIVRKRRNNPDDPLVKAYNDLTQLIMSYEKKSP